MRFALGVMMMAVFGCSQAPVTRNSHGRAIWVTRYNYKTADDIRTLMVNAVGLEVTRVIFQVRGNGDAFYESSLEPWSLELGGKHLGFDPLAVAAEIARKYSVDAIHLDYIRYATDLERSLDFSYDDLSLKKFGRDPKAAPDEWKRFKKDQVTETVRTIRESVRRARPGCRLTAAVFPGPQSQAAVFQDVARWAREGLVDAIYPMNYTANDDEFRTRSLQDVQQVEGCIPVYPGIGMFMHATAEQTVAQMSAARELGAPGVCLFQYGSFFANPGDKGSNPERAELRMKRVGALRR